MARTSGIGASASTESTNEAISQQARREHNLEPGQIILLSASSNISIQAQPPSCPFHGPILAMAHIHGCQGEGLGPMERYLAEGPSQQHAVFIRADTGRFSTSRGCTCRFVLEADLDHHAQEERRHGTGPRNI